MSKRLGVSELIYVLEPNNVMTGEMFMDTDTMNEDIYEQIGRISTHLHQYCQESTLNPGYTLFGSTGEFISNKLLIIKEFRKLNVLVKKYDIYGDGVATLVLERLAGETAIK